MADEYSTLQKSATQAKEMVRGALLREKEPFREYVKADLDRPLQSIQEAAVRIADTAKERRVPEVADVAELFSALRVAQDRINDRKQELRYEQEQKRIEDEFKEMSKPIVYGQRQVYVPPPRYNYVSEPPPKPKPDPFKIENETLDDIQRALRQSRALLQSGGLQDPLAAPPEAPEVAQPYARIALKYESGKFIERVPEGQQMVEKALALTEAPWLDKTGGINAPAAQAWAEEMLSLRDAMKEKNQAIAQDIRIKSDGLRQAQSDRSERSEVVELKKELHLSERQKEAGIGFEKAVEKIMLDVAAALKKAVQPRQPEQDAAHPFSQLIPEGIVLPKIAALETSFNVLPATGNTLAKKDPHRS